MTSLRTIWGIDLEKFSSSFGNEALQHLKEQSHSYLEKGFISHTNGTISLTQNGKLYVDGIASDMFLEEDFKF
jgi:oxygen-independent coproporphyrinogen-3 oxidase